MPKRTGCQSLRGWSGCSLEPVMSCVVGFLCVSPVCHQGSLWGLVQEMLFFRTGWEVTRDRGKVTSPSSRAVCQTATAGGKSLPICVRWETTSTAIKWLFISLLRRELEEFPGERWYTSGCPGGMSEEDGCAVEGKGDLAPATGRKSRACLWAKLFKYCLCQRFPMGTNHSIGAGRGRKPLWWIIHAGCDSGKPFVPSFPSLMSTSHGLFGCKNRLWTPGCACPDFNLAWVTAAWGDWVAMGYPKQTMAFCLQRHNKTTLRGWSTVTQWPSSSRYS